MKEDEFTEVIRQILREQFPEAHEDILQQSPILQYLNYKTISASRGSKARASFGNLYAIYVLVEDYVKRGYHKSGDYRNAEGAKYTELFTRQRQLPFGSKLQNHGLYHRMNQEFRKLFPTTELIPIIRDIENNRYWFNENILTLRVSGNEYNIATVIVSIIDAYIKAKQTSFNSFIEDCELMLKVCEQEPDQVVTFIQNLLRPNVDARIFEIVSFAILKAYYGEQSIFWGWSADQLEEEYLALYKTGRTNANDGGIDFVMRPLGRFFQVTETVNVSKYFLDIDKIQRYPITFVVKSSLTVDEIRNKIEQQAASQFPVQAIIDRYMKAVEEIINLEQLLARLQNVINSGNLAEVISEIIKHSRVEFQIEA